MNVARFEFGSPEYAAACALRHAFLRLPLGLVLTDADRVGEERDLHFGLFVEGPDGAPLLVGGCIGRPRREVGAGWVQLRQVVVDEAWRSRGMGRKLIAGAERLLADEGFTHALLWARAEAAPFYERCGYAPTGEKGRLIGLEHERFEKPLG